MDFRFEALRMDIAAQSAQTRYSMGRVMTGKGQQPKPVRIDECKIFNRLGSKRAGKYYDEMSQEEISKRMHRFKASLKAKPKEPDE